MSMMRTIMTDAAPVPDADRLAYLLALWTYGEGKDGAEANAGVRIQAELARDRFKPQAEWLIAAMREGQSDA